MNSYYRFVSIVAAVVVLIAIASCGKKEDSTKAARDKVVKKIDLADAADSLILEMQGEDSLTVLEILNREHDAKFMSSLKGAYVIKIDGIPNEGGYFWMYSVNDIMGEVACDKYTTKKGDKISWHYRMAGSMQL